MRVYRFRVVHPRTLARAAQAERVGAKHMGIASAPVRGRHVSPMLLPPPGCRRRRRRHRRCCHRRRQPRHSGRRTLRRLLPGNPLVCRVPHVPSPAWCISNPPHAPSTTAHNL